MTEDYNIVLRKRFMYNDNNDVNKPIVEKLLVAKFLIIRKGFNLIK